MKPPRRATAIATLLVALAGAGLASTFLFRPKAAPEAHATAVDLKLPLPAFSLTSEQSKPFGLTEMKGHVTIANFVFTHCPTVCPKLTKRMATVQARTREHGAAVRLLTFTVDPENDTPEVLADYAKKYGADPARWTFLTGSLEAIEGAVMKGFKIAMGKQETAPKSGIMTIFHGEKFVLVDREGAIRGYYDADDEGVSALLAHVAKLAR